MRFTITAKFLILSAAIIFITDVSLFVLINKTSVFCTKKLIVLDSAKYASDDFYTTWFTSIKEKNRFLNDIGLNTKKKYFHNFEEAIELRRLFLDAISIKLDDPIFKKNSTTRYLFKNTLNEKHLHCSHMAVLYSFLLDSLGFKTRIVHMSKFLHRTPDTHVVVEFFDEHRKKWILSDPYYDASFFMNDTPLSLLELIKNIKPDSPKKIKILFGDFSESIFYKNRKIDLDAYFAWTNFFYFQKSQSTSERSFYFYIFYPFIGNFNSLHACYLTEGVSSMDKPLVFIYNLIATIILFIFPLVMGILILFLSFILLKKLVFFNKNPLKTAEK